MLLELRGVRVLRGGSVILDDLNFNLSSGEVACVRGRNGVGKTTLLKTVALLLKPNSGIVLVDNVNVWGTSEGLRSRFRLELIGYVPQFAGLIEELNGWENIELPLVLLGLPDAIRRERVVEAAKLLGVEHLLDRRPGEMSGGERMRVAIARAIAKNPKILLLDEPTASLDEIWSRKLYSIIEDLKSRKAGVVITTADPQEQLPCTEGYQLQGGKLKSVTSRYYLELC